MRTLTTTTSSALGNGGIQQEHQQRQANDDDSIMTTSANHGRSTMNNGVSSSTSDCMEKENGFRALNPTMVQIISKQRQLSNNGGSEETDSTTFVGRSSEIDSASSRGGEEEEYLETIMVADLSFRDDKYKDTLLTRLNTLRRNREMCDVVLLVDKKEIYAHKAVLAAISPTMFDLLSPNQHQTREESPTQIHTYAFGGSGSGGAHHQGSTTNGHHHNHQNHSATTGGGGSKTTTTLATSVVQQSNSIGGEKTTNKTNDQQQQHHLQHQHSEANSTSPVYLEFTDVDFDCFDALIDYAYSGILDINNKKVADLYKTASRFRMQSCAEACAKYLVKQLSPQNCIGIRRCANRTNDFLLASKVDGYIQKNFCEITQKSKEFLALPCLQVEVVLCLEGRPEIAGPMKEERRLGEKVIDWLQQQVHDLPEHAVFRMEMLTQKVHMLFLDEDLILQDCREMEDSSIVGSSDMVQDYKKSSRRGVTQSSSSGKVKGKPHVHHLLHQQVPATPCPKIARFASTDSMNSVASEHDEVEWKIITVMKASESYYTALAVVRRQLAAMTIHVVDAKGLLNSGGLAEAAALKVDAEALAAYSIQAASRRADLAVMETPRCSVGAVCLDGKIVVCGGYDRGECLRSVEQYDPLTNYWSSMTPMQKERGRFDATVLDNKIYAIGGSDGFRDLQCGERYDPKTKAWTKIAQMLTARSNHGITSTNGYVYAIGGCQGQKPVKQCERYDSNTNAWETIAPLQHARYQAGCCAWSNQLIVVSGCDTWNCINSVECYDPITNSWRFLPPISTARRGCGVGVLKGKLYVFGGSDGVHSLLSVEVLDLTDPHATWRAAPSLITARGNVRAVVLDTPQMEVLFAVGGFNGKSFLNTIEYLEDGASEWKTTILKDFTFSTTNPMALVAVLSSIAQQQQLSSLNQAKFIIDEDPVGESQNEAATSSTETNDKDKDESKVEV